MKRITFWLSSLLFLILSVQCTSTRWTVSDLQALDETSEPELLHSRHKLLLTEPVSHSNPFLNLGFYRIDELEYAERIQMERTLQSYRLKWGFTALASVGAALAFYAANTDGLTVTSSRQQSLVFNAAGALLTVAAFTNMRPSGDPIRTGETRYLRRSGSVVVADTVRLDQFSDSVHEFHLSVTWRDESLVESTYEAEEGGAVFRLRDLFGEHTVTGIDPGSLHLTLLQNDESEEMVIPVDSFMRPVVSITAPLAQLYGRPEIGGQEPLVEVGYGSDLLFLEAYSDLWYEVQFGGSILYVSRELGEIRWRESESTLEPEVIPVSEVPFGEISVEFSVPLLKQHSDRDTAWLMSNHRGNRLGLRRHLERDLRLMEFYFREGFSVSSESMVTVDLTGQESWTLPAGHIEPDSASIFYLYLTGFAEIINESGENEIELLHIDEEGDQNRHTLNELLATLAAATPGRFVAFVDLEFVDVNDTNQGSLRDNGTGIYRKLTEEVLSVNGQSALIFASRPDQRSGLYESLRFEMKYHHIFPYFLAQGLQQRRTQLFELVRFLENQVEYTSRRLHDRPQTVQAFGDLSIDLSD